MAHLVAACLVASLVLTGCAAAPPPAPAADPCPLSYPDGTAIDCASTAGHAHKVRPAGPASQEGWTCLARNTRNDGTLATTFYLHEDGRAGMEWFWSRPAAGAAARIEGLILREGRAAGIVVPYQERGFAEWPAKPGGGSAEVRITAYNFLLDTRTGDGPWQPAGNATLNASLHEGVPWYVWSYEGRDGVTALSLMKPRTGALAYSPRSQHVEEPGWEVYATVSGIATQYESVRLDRTAPSTSCLVP